MEIRQLKYFVEICKCNSFSQAAEACYISSQGISMAITRLEDELSYKLFKRTPRGILLTEQGKYLLPRAEQVVGLIEECEGYFSDEVKKGRKLSVMFALGTVEEFASKPIARFHEKYPNIALDVQEGFDITCDEAVKNQEVELGLCVGLPADEKKFDTTLLLSSRNALLVNEKHPLANRTSISAAELKDVPLAIQRFTTRSSASLCSLCRQAGFEPTISTLVDDILLIYHLVSINQCAGVSALLLAKRLDRPNIRIIPFEEPSMMWNAYLIKLKNAKLSPEARAFEHVLLQYRDIIQGL